MCGIAAVVSKNPSLEDFQRAIELISHRGPDNLTVQKISANVIVGHTRLSIIDTSEESNQPFHSDGYTLIFNGEIYNYLELRSFLIEEGYEFRSSGDTEVVLKSFLYWGKDCVRHFRGMWAFVIVQGSNLLFMSRDVFGIKPIVYYQDRDTLIVASECKFILDYLGYRVKPNLQSIQNFYLGVEGSESHNTWFEGIYRLKPSHYAYFDEANKFVIKSYQTKMESKEFLSDRFIIDAMNLRIRSDVPIAAAITNGVDSNVIVYTLKRHIEKLFTVSFSGKKYDEAKQASLLAARYNIDHCIIDGVNAYSISNLRKAIWHLESGHSSKSILSYFQLMREVRNQGYKVFLEGQGADELFGGYNDKLYMAFLFDALQKVRVIKFCQLVFRKRIPWALLEHLNITKRRWKQRLLLIKKENNLFNLKKHYWVENQNFFQTPEQIMNIQKNRGLVNLLHYGDALSMANSVESRLPLLDERVAESLRQEDINHITSPIVNKILLRSILPNEINIPNTKLGFVSNFEFIFSDSSYCALLENTYPNYLLNVMKLLNGSTTTNQKWKLLQIVLWHEEFERFINTEIDTAV